MTQEDRGKVPYDAFGQYEQMQAGNKVQFDERKYNLMTFRSKLVMGLGWFFGIAMLAVIIMLNVEMSAVLRAKSDKSIESSARADTIRDLRSSMSEVHPILIGQYATVEQDRRTGKWKSIYMVVTKVGEHFYFNGSPDMMAKIEVDLLDRMYQRCESLGGDLEFFGECLFNESRFGANTAHKKNANGTFDGGYLGLNKGKYPNAGESPMADVADWCEHTRDYPIVIVEMNLARKDYYELYSSKRFWEKRR